MGSELFLDCRRDGMSHSILVDAANGHIDGYRDDTIRYARGAARRVRGFPKRELAEGTFIVPFNHIDRVDSVSENFIRQRLCCPAIRSV